MAVDFKVTLLGVNSAYPVFGRHPSSQILRYDGHLVMIDCGEGTQMQLSKYKVKRSKINHIFISHLHGDHCYGLPGLLTSFALQSRSNKLTIYGPEGLKNFIEGVFESSFVKLPFPLVINEYQDGRVHVIDLFPKLRVTLFPLKHRVPTFGFRFDEIHKEYNIRPDKIREYEMDVEEILSVKMGKDLDRVEGVIANSELTYPPDDSRSYAYCSDTMYFEEIVDYINGIGLLYHETTYLDDLADLAMERGHSTLTQATGVAKMAGAKTMISGHYSSRYRDIHIFKKMGEKSFDGFLLGEEGKVYDVI